MVKALGRWLLNATAVVALIAATASGASATTALLYDDLTFVTSPWQSALTGKGFTITSVSNDADFLSQLSMHTFDVVVVQFDGVDPTMMHSINALTSYTGKIIYNSAVTQYDSTFQVTDPVSFNDRNTAEQGIPATLNVSPLLSAGLSSSTLTVDNPFYAVPWRSFTNIPATATVAGTFLDDGNAGIVIGNGGRTIINGFMGETLGSDEVQLYKNELGLLTAPVPEPATATLLGLGLVVTAALGYRRRKSARD